VQSQHPVDQLIRELVVTGRAATDEEVMRIIDRMASVPFASHEVIVNPRERGASYEGYVLSKRADSLSYHLIKRIVIERQWRPGTTAQDYTADLRRAVRSAGTRLGIYSRQGGAIVVAIAPTATILTPERLGEKPEPQLLVIYSTDRGRIISGYQFSTLEATTIPQEVRWLR
jgi:hypothetical protein